MSASIGVLAVMDSAASVTDMYLHPDYARDLREARATVERLLEAAQAAWVCIGELPPTQARVEVAQMLQAALAAFHGEGA